MERSVESRGTTRRNYSAKLIQSSSQLAMELVNISHLQKIPEFVLLYKSQFEARELVTDDLPGWTSSDSSPTRWPGGTHCRHPSFWAGWWSSWRCGRGGRWLCRNSLDLCVKTKNKITRKIACHTAGEYLEQTWNIVRNLIRKCPQSDFLELCNFQKCPHFLKGYFVQSGLCFKKFGYIFKRNNFNLRHFSVNLH